MEASLEVKLRELVDRQAIWQLMLDYARGLDRLDRELVRECYWDDAIDDHHVAGGKPDEFITWAFGFHEQFQSITHHNLSNHRCDLDGDVAHAETYYFFIGKNLAPPHVLGWGRYIDHLERRGGQWRIANRVCVIEGNFAVEDHQLYQFPDFDPVHGPTLTASRNRNDLSYQRPVRPRTSWAS